MDSNVNTLFFLVLIVAIISNLLLRYFLGIEQDPEEPPFLLQRIPYFGHVIGIIRHKTAYFLELTKKFPLPIYSLAMPRGRMYIVNSPSLITSVQRNTKSLQFAPFASEFTARICGVSNEATRVLKANVRLENGEWGLYEDVLKAMHEALGPGAGLESMSRLMVESVSGSLDGLRAGQGSKRISLANWLRHEITLATCEAVYGPANPLKDPAVEDAFWRFEKSLTILMINFLPSLTATQGCKARTVVSNAFRKYFEEKSHQTGSDVTKARYKICEKYGIAIEDTSCFEVGGLLAILVNTIPTAFWMIYHIFSDQAVLEDLRAEIGGILETSITAEKLVQRTMNLTSIKDDCPLLRSVFQESLRYRSLASSTREVLNDTVLADRYLLKKGAVIQIPSLVVHSDSTIWGPTVATFDARRFIRPDGKEAGAHKQHAGAFRAFGGGTTLCPGRHLASMEIMCVVAMFVVRYDLTPVSGGWTTPEWTAKNLASAVMCPSRDIEVDVTARKGYENGSWTIRLVGSTSGGATAAKEYEPAGSRTGTGS